MSTAIPAANSPRVRVYRARWIVPIVGEPIADGWIRVVGDRIDSIGSGGLSEPVEDLGEVALLPRLVNAHTHLEFSGLSQPLGSSGENFAAWIRRVIEWRREWQAECGGEDAIAARRAADVTRGIEESVRAGVGAVGEIATPGWPRATFFATATDRSTALAGSAGVIFLELLGLGPARVAGLLDAARQHVDGFPSGARWRAGWSPHAPYTVRLDLVKTICEWSAERRAPVAMHLAESVDELELLQSHSGPLVELLSDLGVWDPTAIPRGIRPGDYLDLLARASRALVVHGNFLGPADWSKLAARRDSMSVVYCPRTYAYFGHGEYPLRAMLDAGVRVAVGTDSRASNPDLSVWNELRFVSRQHPDVSPREVLQLGTLAAATALGFEPDAGSLEAGKLASFTRIPLSDDSTGEIEARLLGDEHCGALIDQGTLP